MFRANIGNSVSVAIDPLNHYDVNGPKDAENVMQAMGLLPFFVRDVNLDLDTIVETDLLAREVNEQYGFPTMPFGGRIDEAGVYHANNDEDEPLFPYGRITRNGVDVYMYPYGIIGFDGIKGEQIVLRMD